MLTWQMVVGDRRLRGKLSRLKRAVLVCRRRDTERALSEAIEDFFIVSEIAARRYQPCQFSGRPSLFVAKRRPFRDRPLSICRLGGRLRLGGIDDRRCRHPRDSR